MEVRPADVRGPFGSQGNFHLRDAIAQHLSVTRAVSAGADEILVTSGAQQAFDLIARALVRPGGTVVAVEEPGYPPMRVPFAAAGGLVVPVPVDAKGILVDRIPQDAGVICVTPSHQFPLGVSLSQARRDDLLAVARRIGAVVIEDDYDGEFRLDGGPLAALRAADAADLVFYVGTFSKSMLPSLRLGFVVPPRWALGALVAAKNASDWHASSPLQSAVAAFVADGHLTRHVARMRRLYAERRGAALSAAAEFLPADVVALPSLYGMHLVLESVAGRDLEAAARALSKTGVRAHGLARYHFARPSRDGIVVGYGIADVGAVWEGIAALGRLLGG